MVKRVQSYFTKAAKKFETDERLQATGTAVEAQALIEEFVSTAMGAVGAACYDKVWFLEADFSGALMVATLHAFRSSRTFCRTLGPLLKRYVDDSLFQYREEERRQKVMWDATSISGLPESYHKRANKNLLAAYDEAHMSAPYGEYLAQSPELGTAQAFVKFWMDDFASKSWDIFEMGVPGGREEHFALLTNLFFYMTDPERSVLPNELLGQLTTPVPQRWQFVETQALELVNKLSGQSKRMRRF
jgi:hypothetical protein